MNPTANPDPERPPKPGLQKPRARGTVVYQCGHKLEVKCLESGVCDACAKQRRIERYKQNQIKLRREGKKAAAFRLPPGSVKTLRWNGADWIGSLTVPGVSNAFAALGKTEKECLHALHAKYAQYLDRKQPEPK